MGRFFSPIDFIRQAKRLANELKRSKRIVIGEKYEEQINEKNLELYKKYKRDMEMRGLSEKSIYGYERDIMQWFSYLVKNQFNPIITDVTEEDIEEFIYYCKEQGNHENRIIRRTASISAFYKFLRRKKIIKENPMEFIARPKKGLPVTVQTFLTKEQYELMREKLQECGDLQLQTFGMFAISTMARVNAIANITWEQINFIERVVDDVLEKEGKIVTLYFSEEVSKLLQQLKQQRKDDNINCEYVFITKYEGTYDGVAVSTLNKWTRKIGEMIGVSSLHPHDFRHSGSQLLKLSGMPIEDISELLNHSGLDVTKNHYLRQDKRKMREKKDQYKI